MAKILIVAYHYPPIQGSSGVHRTLSYSRYLPALGWQPTILTVTRNAFPARMAANDFEDVVTARHPELAVLLASARSADYLMAEMTGSGSTVFAVSCDGEPVRAPEHVSRGAGQILTRTSTVVAAIGG